MKNSIKIYSLQELQIAKFYGKPVLQIQKLEKAASLLLTGLFIPGETAACPAEAVPGS
jgi:hypothetical protein